MALKLVGFLQHGNGTSGFLKCPKFLGLVAISFSRMSLVHGVSHKAYRVIQTVRKYLYTAYFKHQPPLSCSTLIDCFICGLSKLLYTPHLHACDAASLFIEVSAVKTSPISEPCVSGIGHTTPGPFTPLHSLNLLSPVLLSRIAIYCM
jgi:hypothetical protein